MEFEIVKDNKPKSSKKEEQFLVEQPRWTLEEIALSKDTLEQIDEMIAYIHNKEKLLHEWQFGRFLKSGSALSVNFFGLPGTGKSITAEAIANKLGKSIIKVNYGEAESSYIGGTSENLVSIFQKASETSSVLFFDEADSILSRRIANLSQAADHGVNSAKSTLLTLLDQFDGIIIFATNLFDNYDEAFVRRILFNVEFLAPDEEMRKQLWEFHLSENIPKQVAYKTLANISKDGYKCLGFLLTLIDSENLLELQAYTLKNDEYNRVIFSSQVKIVNNLSTDVFEILKAEGRVKLTLK